VDILIAGHHGSKTSTSQALLAQTQPKIVVISVGKNSYGHPAQDTLDRIAAIGATIYRTDQCGTVKLKGA
jgi:competence protein ComEC